MTGLSETAAKRRKQLLRFISTDLLGPIAGKMPKSCIESLEKASFYSNIRKHILDIIPVTEARIVRHEVAAELPPFIRTEAVFGKRNLYLLHDATASPHSGMAWIENKILEESVGSLRRIMDWGDVQHEPLLPASELRLPEPVVVCHPATYYHWLLEVLPNVLFAVAAFPGVKIVLPENCPRYVLEGLATALGPGAERDFVFCSNPIRVERLVVPQYHTQPEFTDPQVLELLRSSVKAKVVAQGPSGTGRKIYISRQKSRRRLAGEPELEERLQKVGFTVLHCEELSFADQIRVFHEAEVVVGSHGAGLSNLVWSEPPCRVIEIFPKNYILDCFAWLSFSLGFDYRHVICDTGHKIDRDAIDAVIDAVR
ncbi:glycosyltransferase family 61 protein [Geomonas nitrogeniifigens]|uniref:Glycosyltransferase family 61 protein n=1 Tax=Geomonas diazotrophica TaxID=2843197 RepID=A0ABX8JDC4_9BACT|nr:glycosyltransferase family 61 protein [Geomonas nitrogeniifigens]QWV96394.1 glycosyltransferase family 61 protein [Geomonas nitrogeniifigens]QXE85461.1 glycosyltransferase family 61 protein [Geomonas nitrogeniifigens]